jgi:hypothetical protein
MGVKCRKLRWAGQTACTVAISSRMKGNIKLDARELGCGEGNASGSCPGEDLAIISFLWQYI